VNLLGFSLYESYPLGISGLYPRQRPPSGSVFFLVIVELLDLVLMIPDQGIPSNLPALLAFGARQRWRDGVWPPKWPAEALVLWNLEAGRHVLSLYRGCLVFPHSGPPTIGGSCGDRAPSGAAVAWRAGTVPSAFKRGFG
jgi:hypothetical protein